LKTDNITYVLITPARNEEATIGLVLKSVVAQTVLPEKWVIVSDGSTDRTDEFVNGFTKQYQWIELIHKSQKRKRNFAGKVDCFNEGYKRLYAEDYDIIGNLDADLSFDNEYFEFLLNKFKEDLNLGVAGTPFLENGYHYDYRFTNIEHVSGACQLFRKQCFTDIGGYKPIKEGGIDWVAVTTARMMGWKTRTFTEKYCNHHRKIGTGNTTALMTWFRQGRKDFLLGNHPIWEGFRSMYQMTRSPRLIGGLLIFLGYCWAAFQRQTRPIEKDLIDFIRAEQMQRLKKFFIRS
jgi:glycosyltransferase involved in cell wall biosynthesis